jgi:hypothetical protein
VTRREERLPPALHGRPLVARVLGRAALVALASRAGRGGRQVPAVPGPAAGFFDYAFSVGLVAALAVAVLALRAVKRPKAGEVRSNWYLAWSLLWGIATIFAAALVAQNLHLARPHHPRDGGGASGGSSQRLPSGSATSRSLRFRWEAAASGGAILLLAGAAVVLVRRRASLATLPEPDEEPDLLPAALGAAFGESLDDLRRESDARRAVIAAYARAEAVLARHGLPRSPAETPLEYLGRVLLGLRVRAAAVLELTELFERAKFSTHRIDAAMKEEAIAALVAVRDDLAAAG